MRFMSLPADITLRRVIPLDYLLSLMLLFSFLVADRLAYTLGSPLFKALLHLGEMALWLWYSLTLFWAPLTSTGARRRGGWGPASTRAHPHMCIAAACSAG